MSNRSLSEIFSEVVNELATLVATEGRLARAEISEKLSQIAVGIGLVVGGAVLLIPAIVILLQAAVAALVDNRILAASLASLLVGGIVLVVGLIIALVGTSRLKTERLLPDRTVRQIRRDVSVAKQQARTPYDEQRAA